MAMLVLLSDLGSANAIRHTSLALRASVEQSNYYLAANLLLTKWLL